MDERQIRNEVSAFHATIDILHYEIEKNEANVHNWQPLARQDIEQTPALRLQIADSLRRIEQLRERCDEIEGQEEQFRADAEDDSLE